jgi:tetratricopeptide (TPR) repeat protein
MHLWLAIALVALNPMVSSMALAQAEAGYPARALAGEDLSAADRAEQYLSRGLARAALALRDEAMIDLTLAINQHALSAADQARALYHRGLLLEEMGDAKNAAADYSGALFLDPKLEPASTRLNALNRMLQPVALRERGNSPPASLQPIATSPPPVLKPALAERSERGQLQIQLGAWRTKAEANDEWKEISTRAADLLQEFTPNILETDVPNKGRFFRLRLGPMNRNAATQLCGQLKLRGQDCILANSP